MRQIFLSLLATALVSTVSVADVGGAGITAEGEVYNLIRPADLSGDYSAVTAGVTLQQS
jgi:ABC-type arginine/histidine transport system permease subunit